ncbi:flagellin N-terminal helical domain-containing protein [Pararhizobium mangrovi]|uniref:Flagellin n=1 Tax=Pararhizobium mangrovi TaxID=2590452 RepID=A0A506U1P8_9HYPH|nr:flagellin [Pararhizobium mangrovi]TPW26895.1 flagellin C [Pararhizobium mangrovi]
MGTSILTNTQSMAALQTLRSINESLDTTQSRISTGKKVNSASDNAAYWSIATTMKSDNQSLSAVSDALGLGASTVDVGYTALNSTIDSLNDIKSRLVTAKQPGVDKSKIQSELDSLTSTIKSTSESASFSGSNLLSIDSTDGDTKQSIVSSLSRTNGEISLDTIDIDTKDTALFDANENASGLLQKGKDVANVSNLGIAIKTGNGSDADRDADPAVDAMGASISFDASGIAGNGNSVTLSGKDTIEFDLSVNGSTKTVKIDAATVNAALGNDANGTIDSKDDIKSVLAQAIGDAGFTVGDGSSNDVKLEISSDNVNITTNATGAKTSIKSTAATSSSNGQFLTAGLDDINVTNASGDDIDNYIHDVDTMIQSVTSAASSLGSTKTQIDNQGDFVSNLMDSIDTGVGRLVDANMNQESTKLKALQTQQQLGIQALSIANSSSQQILSLFR